MIFKNAFKNKEALNKLHEIDKTTARDVNVLVAFIQFYCSRKHGAENKSPVRASGLSGCISMIRIVTYAMNAESSFVFRKQTNCLPVCSETIMQKMRNTLL